MSSELWRVRLPNGIVKESTLDQLDEAFNAGLVDVNAHVMPPGETRWTRLGEALGLEAPVRVIAPSPPSVRPVVSDLDVEFAAERARGSSNRKWIILGGSGAAVVAIIAVVASVGSSGSGAVEAAKAAAAAPPPAATIERIAMPTATATAEDPSAKFTEDQKKKLQRMDKDNEAKAAKRRNERAVGLSNHHRDSKAPPVYMGGGGKGDPMGGSM